MAQTKLTDELSRHLQNANDSEMLDVIIEVEPRPGTDDPSKNASLSRQQRIEALRRDFAVQAAPVEANVCENGGEIVDRAWINQTLKAKVPAKYVEKLSEHQNILALDIPHSIDKE